MANAGRCLRSLRGFYTSYNRSNLYLGVRGFMRPGDFNARELLLVNGHRLNDNIYGGAAIGIGFSLDLDLVDHIEVVRGPGSSLFGTNAMFAVINVITRSVGSDNGSRPRATLAPFNPRTGRATLATGQGQRSALFSMTYHKDPGQPSLFFPQFASPLTNNGYAMNMDGSRFDNSLRGHAQRRFSVRRRTLRQHEDVSHRHLRHGVQ